jgi:transcriptional regulator with XRE-family HTH domain
MDDEHFEAEPGPPPEIGEQLRVAREARGLTLEQVAAETRLPQRHLVTMEAGDFAALPGRTYAVGFAKTYAKAVGLDPEYTAEQVRGSLDAQDFDPRHRPATFEPGDPARVPSRMLGWLSVLAVILVLAGLFAFFRPYFAPAADLPSLLEQQQAEQAAAQARQRAAAAAPAPTGGPVVFTALADGVWVKFYDSDGQQLLQKELAKGESYTVPADADGPQLWTGRPEALAITVGGRAVPKLSEVQKTMRDVPVTAAALLARGAPAPVSAPPTVEPAPATASRPPTARATPRPTPTARAVPAAPSPAPAPSPTA